MGNSNADAGNLLDDFESTEGTELGNGHDNIWRAVGVDPTVTKPDGTPDIYSDDIILGAGGTNYANFAAKLKDAHDNVAHSYIGRFLTDK